MCRGNSQYDRRVDLHHNYLRWHVPLTPSRASQQSALRPVETTRRKLVHHGTASQIMNGSRQVSTGNSIELPLVLERRSAFEICRTFIPAFVQGIGTVLLLDVANLQKINGGFSQLFLRGCARRMCVVVLMSNLCALDILQHSPS